jgi:cadmium resistance protein CadD (predicted permease)
MLAGLPADVAVAATAFVGTNIDNALVTMAMVATAPPERATRIALGQVLGFTILVVAAASTAIALFELSTRTIGLLGLVPLAMGLRGVLALRHQAARTKAARRAVGTGMVAATLITVGAGGDNLAVYIPLFRLDSVVNLSATAAVFVVGEVLLTFAVLRAGRHRLASDIVGRVGVFATPLLYCAIGVLVLIRCGTLPV